MSCMCNRVKKGLAAFTLIELLIVVAIIAILAAIAVPNFLEAQTRAKVTRIKSDFRSLATAIEAYTVDYDQPPIAPKNYSWDATPGVWKRVDGPLELFYTLTTPLAYIPAVNTFIDPFRNADDTNEFSSMNRNFIFINFTTGVNALNSLTWCGAQQTTDLNWFWPGQGGSLAVKTGPPNTMTIPVQYCFNGDKDRKYAATWVLISNGPSREGNEIKDSTGNLSFTWEIWVDADTQAWKCYTEGANGSFYDASNGTKSLGHIWRFSSGAMDQ